METGPANNNAHVQGQTQANGLAGTPGSSAPAPVDSAALAPAQAMGELSRLNEQHALEQIRNTLFAIDEVTYLWSIADDQLTWSENLHRVIPNIIPGRSETGRSFASLLDHENEQNRFDAVVGSSDVDQGRGVPYHLEYKLWPAGVGKGEPIWIEDKGRWYASPEGSAGYAVGAIRTINSRHAHEENLKFLSQYDPLTGMMNRGSIVHALGEAITLAERSGSSCSFVLAAMDNLDVINDAYGFDVADQVIASVSQRLRRHMRNGDSIGRYAGNKFALILNNCNETALKVASERFLQSVRQTVIETDNGPVWTTVSMGGVVLPTHARETYEAMVHAEDALSEAKNRPTDCFVTYKPSKRRASMRERNVSCTGEIVAALKQNRFVLAFQPIMHADTGQPAMYEALLRIAGQDGQVISAGHLLPIAEKLGLIRLIDRRVLEMGIAILQQQPTLRLTLNISGVTATDTRWFEMFVDYIAENRDVAERLMVEITETVALSDLEEIVQFIERLQSFGCKVAIDDFGAGYTSFRNLQIMNIDMVKLDGAFCEDLAQNPDNQYFVKTLVDMAKRFNVEVVAEWVQREEDAALLRQWGVNYLQGHLYAAATIDPPWGRLEQPPTSDEDEQDPIRKVLHAGKPDLPGLQAIEGSPAPGEKWSPERHTDRRQEPSQQGSQEQAPAANLAVSSGVSPDPADPASASLETQATDTSLANAPELPQLGQAERGFDSQNMAAFSAAQPDFAAGDLRPGEPEVQDVPSQSSPGEQAPQSFVPVDPLPPVTPGSVDAEPHCHNLHEPPASGHPATPPLPGDSSGQGMNWTSWPHQPVETQEPQQSPDAAPQNFENLLGQPFGASAGRDFGSPSSQAESAPASPADGPPATAVSNGRPLASANIDAELPAQPAAKFEHSPAEDPFAAPYPMSLPEQEHELPEQPAAAEPAAVQGLSPQDNNLPEAAFGQSTPPYVEDPFSAGPTGPESQDTAYRPAPAASEHHETPVSAPATPPAWPATPAWESVQPDIAASAQASNGFADLSEMPEEPDTASMPANVEQPAMLPGAAEPPAERPDIQAPVNRTSAQPSAFAWLSPVASDHHDMAGGTVDMSTAQQQAAAEPLTPVQHVPQPAPPLPVDLPAVTETVDASHYNGMQPAPEFEPAQPSSNVVSEPEHARPEPFPGGQGSAAQQVQHLPAAGGLSAEPVQSMDTQRMHAAQPGSGFQMDDPFSHMRPPAPSAADPDEFARKLQEALSPLTPTAGATGTGL